MGSLIPSWSALQPFLPEMVLAGTMTAVLVIPMLSPRKNNLGVGVATAMGIFVAICCLLGTQSMGALAHNPAAGNVGGTYLGGMLVLDPFGWFFKLSVLLFGLIVVALWAFTTREKMGLGDGHKLRNVCW